MGKSVLIGFSNLGFGHGHASLHDRGWTELFVSTIVGPLKRLLRTG